jgi:hypothetical protein
MVMELMLIMNIVECAHSFWKWNESLKVYNT